MAPNPPVGDSHFWFRACQDAHALGLLDEDEERRFLAHAASCASCGAALKAYSEGAVRLAREGHIPARILARWDRARVKLRGMARRMVRQHLATCPECRQDLEAIGFRPELEVLADEEVEESAPVAPEVAPGRPIVILRGGARRRSWFMGGIAGATLATAATLVAVSTLRPPVPATAIRVTEPAPSPTAAVSNGYALDVLPAPANLPGPRRGAREGIALIPVEGGARHVGVVLPDLYVPDSTTLELAIVGPDGARIASVRRRYDQLFPRRILLLGSAAGPLRLGDYRLSVRAPFADPKELANLHFRLIARPGPG